MLMLKPNYKREFINVGFPKAIRNVDERPHCVLCGDVLSNESLKKLKNEQVAQTSPNEQLSASQSIFPVQGRDCQDTVTKLKFHSAKLIITVMYLCNKIKTFLYKCRCYGKSRSIFVGMDPSRNIKFFCWISSWKVWKDIFSFNHAQKFCLPCTSSLIIL